MRQLDAQLEAVAVQPTRHTDIPEHSSSATMAQGVYECCLDAKGRSPLAFDVRSSSSIADYYVIASGRSDRHVQGIANKILEYLDAHHIVPYSVEGLERGHWVVIDTVDMVIHVMYEPERERYDLESLWLDGASTIACGEMRRSRAGNDETSQ